MPGEKGISLLIILFSLAAGSLSLVIIKQNIEKGFTKKTADTGFIEVKRQEGALRTFKYISDPKASPVSSPRKHVSVIEYIKARSATYSVQPQATPSPLVKQVPSVSPSPSLLPPIQKMVESPVPSKTTPAAGVLDKNAALSMVPLFGAYGKKCTLPIDIHLSTASLLVDGVDVVLRFEPARFQLTSIEPVTSFNGKKLDFFIDETFVEDEGSLSFSLLSGFGQPISGIGKIARVTFKVRDDAILGTSQIKFHYDPQITTASNVIEYGTVNNILKSVTDGNFSIVSDMCE